MATTVHPDELADGELVDRLRSGDERALAILYDRHGTTVYSLALSIVREAADAEEVVTDTFLQLWRSDAHDPSRGSVGAYLSVIARSRAIDKVRARRRRARAVQASAAADPTGFALEVSEPASPDAEAAVSRARAVTREALSALPAEQRDAIALSFLEGYTHSEIAERTSAPLGTVKTRIRDGMKKLRAALAPPEGEPA